MTCTSRIKKALGAKGRKESYYGKIQYLPTGSILPNPSQPRKNFNDEALFRLAESVLRYGVLQPLSVRFAKGQPPDPSTPLASCRFELIAGERRLRAAKIAGLHEVPCILINADDKKSAELALIENLQREDLNLFEQAGAISSLIDVYGMTQEQAAHLLGMTQAAVSNKLRLLKLTSSERRLIVENSLSERHARALLKLSDPDLRSEILQTVVKKGLTVAGTEALIDRYLSKDIPDSAGEGSRKMILKDLRIVYNTLDRALDVIEQAGIAVAKEKHESEDAVELIITISKRREGA